jgi:hypothetical protein
MRLLADNPLKSKPGLNGPPPPNISPATLLSSSHLRIIMLRQLSVLALLLCSASSLFLAQDSNSGHYLFAWVGAEKTGAKKTGAEKSAAEPGNDFLAVIDADPASPSYGHLVTTLATDQKTQMVHHTEYIMPVSGMLFANDHTAGRTFIFDLRDPLHPKVATSFTDVAGYMHPHSYLRLPNGHILATFQHSHDSMSPEPLGKTGGLVEIDDSGRVIRSSSSADPAFSGALLTPYSLVVLPEIDRVVSTNSSMHFEDIFRGLTYQVWRLSDLKLLKTAYLDEGGNHYAQISPEEPRLGPDGAVYVQTLGCGIERITGIASAEPKSQLVYSFPTSFCGVPTIVGHYLIQPISYFHTAIVLDIADGTKPVEVARLKFDDNFFPHWTSWDAKTQRLVVTSGNSGLPGLLLLKFDQTTGALTLDEAFHDDAGKPGMNFIDRSWPQGWTGSGRPHGAVFSR